jgi:AraC family transcriptional regulator
MARQAQPLPVTTGSPLHVTVDVGAFRVHDARFPGGLELAPHEHEYVSYGVVLEGSLDVRLASGTHVCGEGTVESKPAGERHGNRFGRDGARVLVIEPTATSKEMLRPVARCFDVPLCFGDLCALSLARRIASELRSGDSAAPLAIEGLVLELLASSIRQTSRPPPGARPPWLDRARDMLHERFREPLRTHAVAAAAGVHPAYLARVFRAHFGHTMGSYVRELRLAWAADQLAHSQCSVAAVAFEAGFSDQSSFTHAFRDWAGTTPGAFRSRSASEPDAKVPPQH